jgi:hypothetical protein
VDNEFLEECVSLPAPEDLDGRTLGGIYPSALTLNKTTASPSLAHFLGMSIHDRGAELELDLYDKRNDFPFRVIRYPNRESVIPSSIPYGVFTGHHR